jgi:hypothetical protein
LKLFNKNADELSILFFKLKNLVLGHQ